MGFGSSGKQLAVVILLGSACGSCGGRSASIESAASGGNGSGASGGGTSTSCTHPVPAPQLQVTANCSGFTPNLLGSTVDFVSADPLDPKTNLVTHHFSAPASASNGCGFELTISIPLVTFRGSGSYNLNAWWGYLDGAAELQAAALIRSGDPYPFLGVADADSGSLLSDVSAPIAIQALGPDCQACPGDGGASLKSPALSSNNLPLTCVPAPGNQGLLQCSDATNTWTVVDYCAVEGTDAFPAVYGRADLLQ